LTRSNGFDVLVTFKMFCLPLFTPVLESSQDLEPARCHLEPLVSSLPCKLLIIHLRQRQRPSSKTTMESTTRLNCLRTIERFIILSLLPGLRSRRYGQPTESVLDARDCVLNVHCYLFLLEGTVSSVFRKQRSDSHICKELMLRDGTESMMKRLEIPTDIT
jgi:hypothetical protein